ncbi:MAG: rhodanese-like domain-containing protein [Ferruginibacter sp.]
MIQSITPAELKKRLASGEDIQLIDVRELWEHEFFNVGGNHIPLGELMENVDMISIITPVVFYCQKGIRSQIAIQRLQQKFAFKNLLNLSGGMEAWKANNAPAK